MVKWIHRPDCGEERENVTETEHLVDFKINFVLWICSSQSLLSLYVVLTSYKDRFLTLMKRNIMILHVAVVAL